MVFRRVNTLLPVAQLRDEMDRLVHDFFTPPGDGPAARWVADRPAGGFPPLNIWDDGDALYAEAELPGVNSEDLDISVMAGDLTIRGRRGEPQQSGVAYHRQERGTGQFNRVLRLPVEVDASKVEASLTDGVLRIKLPKAESAKPKKIKVSSGQ